MNVHELIKSSEYLQSNSRCRNFLIECSNIADPNGFIHSFKYIQINLKMTNISVNRFIKKLKSINCWPFLITGKDRGPKSRHYQRKLDKVAAQIKVEKKEPSIEDIVKKESEHIRLLSEKVVEEMEQRIKAARLAKISKHGEVIEIEDIDKMINVENIPTLNLS